jgi:hypothetical protein
MNTKKMLILLFSILGLVMLTLLIGKIFSSMQFSKQIKTLFAHSKNISDQTFQKSQLEGLPEPVQRYFNLVLKEGQPYISSVRMKHDGHFKTGFDKDWINITGEQYATAEKPGFIWKGSTTFFSALDLYIEDQGRLTVSLLSLVKIMDGKGATYNQGELLRWLGESVLYPTNLLPSERMQWFPIDDHTAKCTFTYKELSLFFICTFNAAGEITEMQTRRYMDEKHMETWVIKVSDYQEMNQVKIPTKFEVLWRLPKGDFSYAKFNIKTVEYNILEQF